MHQGQQFGPGIGELVQKEIPDNVGLDQELLSIVAMLEIAAAAPSVPGAGWIDPRRVGFNDCCGFGVQIPVFLFGDGDGHHFLRQDLPDKDDPSVFESAEAETAIDDLFDPDLFVRVLQICFSGDFS